MTACRFEVPALSAAGEICRSRLARPQDRPRLLRLSRRDAGKQADPGEFENTAADDRAFLIYTSGTSGTPKGVLHAQRAAAARAPMYLGWYGIHADDRLLHAGAFNWTYTLGVGLMDPLGQWRDECRI
jgi:acyl-coenzyme A synthetase/AMP-(fatty) acid ligase